MMSGNATMHLSELRQKSLQELSDLATGLGVETVAGARRQDLVFAILKVHGKGEILADGTLEVLPDGFGFLRAADQSYQPGADDVYVSPSQIRRFHLRTGDSVAGVVRPPKESERYFALLRVDAVNGRAPEGRATGLPFDERTPIHPNRRIRLEHDRANLSTRLVDLLAPMGFGQRVLLYAPPRAGRTTLLEDLAHAVEDNHPDTVRMVLVVDERPEEITDLRREIDGEVVASTFDEAPTRHVQLAEIVLEKAKRLAEDGKDVVVLVDSLTRLARAYGAVVPASGRTHAAGVEPAAIHRVKRFLAAGRCLAEGGSVTVIGAVLTETGNRADEVVAEELAGCGSAELHLHPQLAERRLYPALDLARTHTRHDDLLIPADQRAAVAALRNELIGLPPEAALARARERLAGHADNAAVLASLPAATS
jgi:transcription termination factor Rho